MAGKLRVIGAYLLAACFALPMKSCTEYRDETGAQVTVSSEKAIPPGVREVTTRYYLVQQLRADNSTTWLQVAAFIIPLVVVIYGSLRPTAPVTNVLWFIEPLLLAGVLLSLDLMLIGYDPDVGTYVARTAVGIFLLGWVGEAYGRWRSWKLRRLTTRCSGR